MNRTDNTNNLTPGAGTDIDDRIVAEILDAALDDEALMQSFPASDPIAISRAHSPVRGLTPGTGPRD